MYRTIRLLILSSGIIAILVYCLRMPNLADAFLFGSLASLVYAIFVCVIGERIRRLIEGYYAFIRGGADDGDVVYVEGARQLRFFFERRAHIVYVPSNKVWVEVMPDWAKHSKETIVARVKGQLGKHWSFEETEMQDRLLRQ